MKKILLVTLSALLCTSLTACSGISANNDDTAWVDEGAAMISSDIRSSDWTDIHATIMGIDALQEQE